MSEIRYGQPGGILVDDEGTRLGRATEIDFVGGGVTATISGTIVTVTIPGGVAAVSINNTVFVDKTYGNNATGVCERMDKPFLTIAAARAAAVAFFVGGDAPSATNRILFKIQPGSFAEQIVLLTFADWDLTDCTLSLAAGAIITDGGASVDSIIYGNSQTASTGTSVISISGATSNVRMFCDLLTGAGTTATVLQSNGTLVLNVRSITALASISAVTLSGGALTINLCTITQAPSDIATVPCINSTGGTLITNDCIITSGVASQPVCQNVTTGVCTFNSTRIVCTGATASVVSNLSGTMILKNVTLIATGTASVVAASTVKIYGSCETNKAVGAGVVEQVNTITVDTNVI